MYDYSVFCRLFTNNATIETLDRNKSYIDVVVKLGSMNETP